VAMHGTVSYKKGMSSFRDVLKYSHEMKDGIATKIGLITIKITGFISTYMSVLMRYQNKVFS
jgi:hypothetical protein